MLKPDEKRLKDRMISDKNFNVWDPYGNLVIKDGKLVIQEGKLKDNKKLSK